MGKLKLKKVMTKEEKRQDRLMAKIAAKTLLYFGYFDEVSSLNCSMCEDFKQQLCAGRDLTGDDILDCMATKVN